MSSKANKGGSESKRPVFSLVSGCGRDEWRQTGYVRVVGKDRKSIVTAVKSTDDVLHVKEISPGAVARLFPEERELIRRRFIERERTLATAAVSAKVTNLQARALNRLTTIIAQDDSPQVA